MTQTIILAAGLTAASSADVIVAQGEQVTVGIYSTTANAALKERFEIQQLTPGAANVVGYMGNDARATVLSGPGTFRVIRPALASLAFGAFKEA